MLPALILGSQQLGDDIETYFMPLVEDMNVLLYNMEWRSRMSTSVTPPSRNGGVN
jgi:hypothetical protein